MICNVCGGKTRVVDTGTTDTVIFRRRKCKDCGKNFMTKESYISYYNSSARKVFRDKGYKKG